MTDECPQCLAPYPGSGHCASCGWNPAEMDCQDAIEKIQQAAAQKDAQGESPKEIILERPQYMDIQLEADGRVLVTAEGHLFLRALGVKRVNIQDRRETVTAPSRVRGALSLEALYELKLKLEQEMNAFTTISSEMPDSERAQLDALRRDLKEIDKRLSFPTHYHDLRCWMVDVHGESSQAEIHSDLIQEFLDEALERPSDEHEPLAVKAGDLIAKRVETIMRKYGGRLTDSGMGGGHWHMGSHCTEAEATALCCALHTQLGKLIAKGIIYLKRIPWSVKIKELGD